MSGSDRTLYVFVLKNKTLIARGYQVTQVCLKSTNCTTIYMFIYYIQQQQQQHYRYGRFMIPHVKDSNSLVHIYMECVNEEQQ